MAAPMAPDAAEPTTPDAAGGTVPRPDPRGYVLAFASVAGQRHCGVAQPVLVRMDAHHCHPAGGTTPVGPLRQPRVGAGLAFTLTRPLDDPRAGRDVAAAVGPVLPALVFFDTPGGAWPVGAVDAGAVDTGAGNAALAGVVTGGTPRPANVDLRLTGCLLYRNGELAGTGAGGALLGSPVDALVRLADTARRLGWPLEPGQTLVVSSMVPELAVAPGDRLALQVAGFAPVTAVVPTPRKGGGIDD